MYYFILLGDSFSGLTHMDQSALSWILRALWSFLLSSKYSVLQTPATLVFSDSHLVSTILLVCWATPTFFLLVPAPGKSLWGTTPGQLLSSPCLFPTAQGSLSFTAWCPVCWKLLFYTFFHFSFVSKLRVNLVAVIAPWLEAECRRYVITFGPCY